jgi:glycosyltransferase involved in cell wall biosynthesis
LDLQEQLELVGLANLAKTVCAKTQVIPNGINLPETERSRGQKIIFVGRLIRNKGVADLIEAMKCLPGYELLIVGDGPDRPRLEQLAVKLPVTFIGQVDPPLVLNYLSQARVLVLPSYAGDGFPNVVLEAMACGLPVVATAIAGIPDLVQHGQTGYLFEAGHIQQMVTYIKQIMQDNDLQSKLGQQSLEAAQTYSWDVVTSQVEQLFYHLIRQAS